MIRTARIAALLALLPGCLDPTEIVLSIRSDRKLADLSIQIERLTPEPAVKLAPLEIANPTFPITVGLFGEGGKTIRVDVEGHGPISYPARQSATVSFVDGKVMLLVMSLDCCGCLALKQDDLREYSEALAKGGLDATPSACVDARLDGAKPDRASDGPRTELGPDAPRIDARKDGPTLDLKKDTLKPDTRPPDGLKPDQKKPDGPKPDTKKVDGPKPDQAKPDLVPKPDVAKPDLPKPDLPKPDQTPKPDMTIPTLPSCSNGYCFIPAGSFMMGSPPTDPCQPTTNYDEFYHQVNLGRHFEMGETEFTVAQLNALKSIDTSLSDVSSNKSCGTSCPVEQVTWNQAAYLCNLVSAQRGKSACFACSGTWPVITSCTPTYSAYVTCPGYRLPTEAEWEYALRAGTTTVTYLGDPVTGTCTETPSATTLISGIAWYGANGGGTKHPVGQKGQNPWGLKDMFGNVQEWTADDYVLNLTGYPDTDPWVYNPAPTALTMSTRGGSFKAFLWSDIRAGNRSARINPETDLGFRCVRSLTGTLP